MATANSAFEVLREAGGDNLVMAGIAHAAALAAITSVTSDRYGSRSGRRALRWLPPGRRRR
jgi:hypothetical protein